jgi:hypothetical protein
MATQVLYLATDHVLELAGLSNGLTGAAISDATVTVSLADANGVAITGATWPIPAIAVVGQDGTYRATVPDDLTLTARQWVTATVVADAGPGLKRTWLVPLRVEGMPR